MKDGRLCPFKRMECPSTSDNMVEQVQTAFEQSLINLSEEPVGNFSFLQQLRGVS